MDLDLIWIETGVFKNKKYSRKELIRPVMGAIFSYCGSNDGGLG